MMSRFRILTCVSLVCILFSIRLLSQTDPDSHDSDTVKCNSEIISALLKTKEVELSKKHLLLKNFLSGEYDNDADLNALFGFNINDRALYNTFKKELLLSQKNKVVLYPECETLDQFTSLYNRINLLEKQINSLKLYFLNLSQNQRSLLLNRKSYDSIKSVTIRKLTNSQLILLKKIFEIESALKNLLTLKQNTIESENSVIIDTIIELFTYQKKVIVINTSLLDQSITKINSIESINERVTKLNAINNQNDTSINHIIFVIRQDILRLIELKQSSLLRDLKELPVPVARENLQGSKPLLDLYQAKLEEILNYSASVKNEILESKQLETQLLYTSLVRVESFRKSYIIKNGYVAESNYYSEIKDECSSLAFRIKYISVLQWLKIKNIEYSSLYELLSLIIKILSIPALFLMLLQLSKIVIKLIEKLRLTLLKRDRRSPFRMKVSILLKRVEPFVNFILWFIYLYLLSLLIMGTWYENIHYFVPYVFIYISFSFATELFRRFLKFIFIKYQIVQHHTKLDKINSSGTIISSCIFVALVILYVINDIIGEAALYNLVVSILFYLSLPFFLIMVSKWYSEICAAVTSDISSSFSDNLIKVKNRLSKPIITFILLCYIFIYKSYILFSKSVLTLEITRKIFARILRKRIEASGAVAKAIDIETLPGEYRSLFSLGAVKNEELMIYPHTKDLEIAKEIIYKWLSGSSDEISLAICGEKGIGKSSMLGLLSASISIDYPDTTIIKKIVPPKITTRESVITFFESIFGISFNNRADSIIEFDKTCSQTILMIDDAHNFFISGVGAFDGIKTLFEIINYHLKNIYICITLNIHSWIYLEGVFYRNRFFRNIIQLEKWEESDIQEMITKRNNFANIKLRYDSVIAASMHSAELETTDSIEKSYFRLLWEQSEGNPRAALYLWLSSIEPAHGYYKIGLPKDPEMSMFENIQKDALFVYASIIRHENLSLPEMSITLNMPDTSIQYALKIGIELSILYCSDDQRYRVNPSWHALVVKYLKQRNLLYAL